MQLKKTAGLLLMVSSVIFLLVLIVYIYLFISGSFSIQAQLGFGSDSFYNLVYIEAAFAILTAFGCVIMLVSGMHAFYSKAYGSREGNLLMAIDSVLIAILLLGMLTIFCSPPQFISGPRLSAVAVSSCNNSQVSFTFVPLIMAIVGTTIGSLSLERKR
ncbi:MAG: hypothetical protein KGH72_02870 [Candidatus Micrarchaeota archaeon]|nr:hypothetical protein [Candidatus Micrarchaeota archaeon]